MIIYSFIGDDVKGEQPAKKYTNNILRIVTGDLSKENVGVFKYFVTKTNVKQTQRFIDLEIPQILSGNNLEQITDLEERGGRKTINLFIFPSSRSLSLLEITLM